MGQQTKVEHRATKYLWSSMSAVTARLNIPANAARNSGCLSGSSLEWQLCITCQRLNIALQNLSNENISGVCEWLLSTEELDLNINSHHFRDLSGSGLRSLTGKSLQVLLLSFAISSLTIDQNLANGVTVAHDPALPMTIDQNLANGLTVAHDPALPMQQIRNAEYQ